MQSSDKLKILGICLEDPEVLIGGMGRHVGEIYRAMAKRDDVQISLLTSGPDEGPKIHDGYIKYYTDKLVAWKPQDPNLVSHIAIDIQGLRTILKLVAEGTRWDLVHIHDWNCIQIGRAIRDALQIPMIGTMHLCLTYLMETGGVYERKLQEDELYTMQMEGHLAADTDSLILCGEAFADIVEKTFMLQRHIDIIPNGIDLSIWNPDVNLPPIKSSRPVALFVGRIADMKGIRPLLDAVAAEDTGFQIVLCGDVNADTDEIKENWDVTKKIRALEKKYPERLAWIGFQKDNMLKALYKSATVGIMPSIHEPFGIVALEHMAMGLPLISTEVDGLGEIVVDEDGEEYSLIIPPGSPQAINAALKMCKDITIRRTLINQGLKRARQFSWDEVAAQTIKVYERAHHDCINRSNSSKESYKVEGASS